MSTRWRFAWAWFLGGLVATASCSIIKPPKPEPTPPPPQVCPEECGRGTACTDPALGCQPIPPPGPECASGQFCGCWHFPEDSRTWLYACCTPWLPGGIVNVVAGPAQCPTPPPPPSCPEACPEGQHCLDPAVGCVPKPPTPPPAGGCPYGTCPNVYINAKKAGKYGDSTMRCRDRAYCEKATGIPGTTDCALGVESTPQRMACELAHAPGCHRWQFQAQDGSWQRCLPAPAWASCDHFDRWSEGTPYTGPCDVDASGAPIAGWQTIPRGNTYFRACGAGPTAGVCSGPVKFDQ